MTRTNKSSKTHNFFKKIKGKFEGSSYSVDPSDLIQESFVNQSGEGAYQNQAPYYSPELSNVLFLSKRGMSRAPLAREVMRKLLHLSDLFGSIRPSARGISDAYEFCSFDKRMVHSAKKFGYELAGNARRINMSELSSANLIITLDRESEEYTKSRHFYIRGEVKAIGAFLPTGDAPYVPDPFESDEFIETQAKYDQIIRLIETGCQNLLKSFPSLV